LIGKIERIAANLSLDLNAVSAVSELLDVGDHPIHKPVNRRKRQEIWITWPEARSIAPSAGKTGMDAIFASDLSKWLACLKFG